MKLTLSLSTNTLDEVALLAKSLRAVSALMVPGGDIQDAERDNLSILLQILADSLADAAERAHNERLQPTER